MLFAIAYSDLEAQQLDIIKDSAMDLLMFILDGAFVDNEGNDE